MTMTSRSRPPKRLLAGQSGVNNRLPILLLAGLWVASCTAGCASRVATKTIATPDCEARLLIATMDSEFKNAVLSEVTKTLEKDRVCIKIIDVEDLEATATRTFAAVVLITDYQFLRMDGDVKRFIEKADSRQKKKLVMLTTAGTPSSVSEVPEVDAITSASKPADAAAVAKRIVDKVRARLSSK
jgi:hypothetical protein